MRKLLSFVVCPFSLWLMLAQPTAGAQSEVVITEFMAANSRTLTNDLGAYSDWIEIYNTSSTAVNLNGWHLTDNRNNLTKWTFPATNIVGQGFMIIFASGEDRRIPGRPLHTDFELSRNGEFLALVKPDGVTIASSFSPAFPPQIDDVSYGLPTLSLPTVVLGPSASAHVYVPSNNSLGLDWTQPIFDDSGWLRGTNGVGFETSPAAPSLAGAFSTDIDGMMRNISPSAFVRIPFVVTDPSAFDVLTLRTKYDDGFAAYINGTEAARRNLPRGVANSVSDFSGTQGSNNWYYGHYNKTADGDASYQASDFTPFPRSAGGWSSSNFWVGTLWAWFPGGPNPPSTQITATGGTPNGTNNASQHWAVRRWVSEVAGTLTVRSRIAKSTVTSGNGVTGRIFHNGAQIFSRTIAFNDAGTLTNDVSIPGVMVGDFIDLALDPTGTDGLPTDASDGSIFTAVIDVDPGLPLEWNTPALSSRADGPAVVFEDVDITTFATEGGIQAGTNWLAIHGANVTAADGDFLIAAQIETRSSTIQFDQARYFTTPTPGRDNGAGVENLGPIISEVEHTPNMPKVNEDIIVTARVSPTFSPVAAVTLRYRIMFMQTNSVPMLDDGLHGDGAAGDGVYGAFIPSTLSTNGQMRRWYITATDNAGRPTRFPAFASALNSPEYLGTIVELPQTNNLPILHMFIVNPLAANNTTGTRCSLFYDGEFYDNLGINLHGQSSSGFAVDKKSYDIDFHPGHNFRWKDGEPLVDDINLVTTYADKAKMRNILPHETYRDAGAAHHFVQPVRVQQNGTFFAIYDLLENGDDNWLERIGRDPNGALYKMYNTFTDAASDVLISSAEAEKKTRRQEGNADLVALFNGLANGATPLQTKTNYMFDNINIPATIDFLAARMLTGDVDCCHKNYYFYRDTDGTGEWEGMPWDVDLSFGRNWNSTEAYFDNAMYPNNGLGVGGNNGVFGFLISTYAPTRQMYLRRIRTLLDTLLQSTNTPLAERKYEKRIDELFTLIDPDNQLDLAKWGTWRDSGGAFNNGAPTFDTNHIDYETLTESVARLKQYLIDRRVSLYNRVPGEIPAAQPTNTTILIGAIEFNPSNANQAQEYIELRNPNNYAVDISGWTLSGGINHTFQGGAVIPSGGVLYVSPDVKAFRARTTSPRGGEGRFVQGNYRGQLSARGETLALTDTGGRLVSSNAYVGAPSLPQLYLRITEIMYNPSDPGSGPYLREDFEYLELKNIGPVAMNLTGVHFTNGIDFVFSSANRTNLNAGETLILAKNPAAFSFRYPAITNVTGPYLGSLNNGGEVIRLDDAVGEKILEFSYNNSWYPMTDGNGLSLVIVNENAPWFTWDDKLSWRPSSVFDGSPGAIDPPALTFATILVNEVLTHTDIPAVDAIELYNPTTNDVNIGNWLISDDFEEPRKYRIPAPTIISAGGYRVFTESDFNPNPGTAPSFSFSSQGDQAFVFSGDSSGNPNGYFHGFEFGAALTGVSFGRYTNSAAPNTNSAAEIHIVAQSSNTFGFANARPKVGPLIISEIMYHPPDLAGGVDNTLDEFVELQNITTNPVPLFDEAFPTNRWKLDDAVEFTFSTNDVVPANGFILVVSFDPATNGTALANFRARYGVPAGVAIVGPFSGKLDNNGFRTDDSSESVELYRPDAPDTEGVPFVLVERVDYSDSAPWNAAADGFGPSLQRKVVTAYGNHPTNWTAGLPSAGTTPINGQAPTITLPPQNVITVEGRTTNLSVSVSGTAPISYQWQRNGVNLPGETNVTLVFTNIQLSQTGAYSVVVFNPIDVVFSDAATVSIHPLPRFTAQPFNQNVLPGTNVTLTAAIAGTGTVRYQWRFNGTDIPNATNAAYSFTGANLATHHGNFSVVVTDDIGTLASTNAFIYVLVRPAFIIQPAHVTLANGGTAVFTCLATGAPPIYYRWIRNGVGVQTSTVPVLVLTNVLLGSPNPVPIRCAATNLASGAGGINSFTVNLLVQADADVDGVGDPWETQYGFSTSNTADGALDFDGDGASNHDEYVASTDPTNALSVLELALTAGNTALQFVAQSNLSYSVQYRTNLSSAPWTSLTNVPGVTNGVRTIQVNVPNPPLDWERFYRVATPIDP